LEQNHFETVPTVHGREQHRQGQYHSEFSFVRFAAPVSPAPEKFKTVAINKIKVGRRLVLLLMLFNMAAVGYMVCNLPSMPSMYADESWAATQMAECKERGILEEFTKQALQAFALEQDLTMRHLFALTALSGVSIFLSGASLYFSYQKNR
jgi:hypothetical protein